MSVVIPAYNAARTVGAAVDSVLTQTAGELELIVVNDGSTDDTARIVGSRSDPRLRCVTTPNQGVAAARNHGIALSSGDYVAFLDADDVWKPEKLARQVRAMQHDPACGLSFVTAQLVDDELRPVGVDLAADRVDYTKALLIEGNVIAGSASSAVLRRDALEAAGPFDVDLSQCADWDLWLRLSRLTRFRLIVEPLVLLRAGPGTMSSDPALLERDTFRLLEKFFADPASAPYHHLRRRAYANHRAICSGSYLHARQLRDALRCLALALVGDPRTAARLVTLPVRWLRRRRMPVTRSRRRRHLSRRRSVREAQDV